MDFEPGRRTRAAAGDCGAAGRTRLRPLPEPRQHRRAASSHSPAAHLPARSRVPAAAGSCADTFARLIAAGVAPERLHEAVASLEIELVFTAHPTEIARRTLVQKYNRIAAALMTRDRPDLTIPEQEQLLASLRREIATAWATSDVREERPSPLDEVRSGLVVFEQSLWDAVPRYLRQVDGALASATGSGLPLEADADSLRILDWRRSRRQPQCHAGGDPSCVSARALGRRRSVSARGRGAPRRALARVGERRTARACRQTPPSRIASCSATCAGVSWRRGTGSKARSGATRTATPPAEAYVDATDLREALQLCARSLEDTGHALVAEGRLADLLRRLAVFDVTLARLDVRQDASRHTEALDGTHGRRAASAPTATGMKPRASRFCLPS